jgi:hypothetical protein
MQAIRQAVDGLDLAEATEGRKLVREIVRLEQDVMRAIKAFATGARPDAAGMIAKGLRARAD